MAVGALGTGSDTAHRAGAIPKVVWGCVTALALLVGVASLRYALPRAPGHAPLPNFRLHHGPLIAHAITASVALLLGPWQFVPGLLRRRPAVHRWIGRAYVGAVALGAATALWIAPHAAGGIVSTLGFGTLAVLWLGATAMGLRRAWQRDILAHRRWMTRSYALTAAAIMLRLQLPAAIMLHFNFFAAYRVISWLCWLPNLLLVELWLRTRPEVAPYRAPFPALPL